MKFQEKHKPVRVAPLNCLISVCIFIESCYYNNNNKFSTLCYNIPKDYIHTLSQVAITTPEG